MLFNWVFSAVQFLQHVASFDLVVLIRPLSGLESGFESGLGLLHFIIAYVRLATAIQKCL